MNLILGTPYATRQNRAQFRPEETDELTNISATVQKIITEVLSSLAASGGPPGTSGTSSEAATGEKGQAMSFAKETRDLLIECCVEFITMLSSEANEIAEKDAKKTIACEHITKALQELGFSEYVPELLEVAESFRTSQVVSNGQLLSISCKSFC